MIHISYGIAKKKKKLSNKVSNDSYIGRKGRCNNITNATPWCANCLSSWMGVEIKQSDIPGAGQGLFTTKYLTKMML